MSERHGIDYLMSRVSPEPNTGCWLWTGGLVGNTKHPLYGMVGRNKRAHRVMFELLVGPIPPGLVLDHLCRQTSCVNPDHLEPVTHRENILRGVGSPARNAAKEHCKHGHPLSGDNVARTVRSGKEGRRCRACAIRHHRLSRLTKRLAKESALAARIATREGS